MLDLATLLQHGTAGACLAAIIVLLMRVQLKDVALGANPVLCFSVGLAPTPVLPGEVATIGMRHASQRWAGIGRLANKAPYLSGSPLLNAQPKARSPDAALGH